MHRQARSLTNQGCGQLSMLIYRNHKQLKTNTSHNDRALSVTIRTEESGKKY
jgi:hypothetical protein